MSLYNMVMGNSPQAPLVLALLEKAPGDFGRFRDAWIEKREDGALRMVVYTRNGGGNREDYQSVFDSFDGHPLYLGDEDDDYDCTYASLFFKVPPDADARVAKFAEEQGAKVPDGWTIADVAQPTVNMGDRWGAAIEAIGKAPTGSPTSCSPSKEEP